MYFIGDVSMMMCMYVAASQVCDVIESFISADAIIPVTLSVIGIVLLIVIVIVCIGIAVYVYVLKLCQGMVLKCIQLSTFSLVGNRNTV